MRTSKKQNQQETKLKEYRAQKKYLPRTYTKPELTGLRMKNQRRLKKKIYANSWKTEVDLFHACLESFSISDENYWKRSSPQYKEMLSIIDENANSSNPRSLFINCWTIVTRDDIENHPFNKCDTVSKQHFSGDWGSKESTDAKIFALARRARLIKDGQIPLIKLKLTPSTRIYPVIDPHQVTPPPPHCKPGYESINIGRKFPVARSFCCC